MNYKTTFYFVAECLSVNLENKNRRLIENKLKSNKIDWNAVVKLSTSHYVFCALYCNLKRANFLRYLPEDLVVYMQNITDLNRNRNLQIIQQAKKLNTLLLDSNITPVFLKGTGNLIANLYEDVAERMVGDIDFIFSEEDYPRAIDVLLNDGYHNVHNCDYYNPDEKHYRRLKKESNIAAIEIHHDLLINKYRDEFNFNLIKKDVQIINGLSVLSYNNKLNLSIISKQINDQQFYYNRISLRNAYDVLLLSKKTVAKNSFNMLIKLKYQLNCFLAACYEIFNNPISLEYKRDRKTQHYLTNFKNGINFDKYTKFRYALIKIKLVWKYRLGLLYNSIFYKKYRNYLFKKISNFILILSGK